MRTRKKLTHRTEYTAKARKAIHKRDGETCVFCAMGYEMPEDISYCNTGLQIMHIVPRSKFGMGVEQNGTLGCIWHHNLMDNGNKGLRAEMIEILEEKMKIHYPEWSREQVTYSKYGNAKLEAGAEEKVKTGSRSEPCDGFERIAGIKGSIPI